MLGFVEITNARRTLWPKFKAARAHPSNRVSISYPAKLLVNGAVVCDMFPDWDQIMKGSRISLEQSGVTNNSDGTSHSNIATAANDRYQNDDSYPGNNVELMETQECPSRPHNISSVLTPQNLSAFMPGQGRGSNMGVGSGRGLTYEQEPCPRNSASRIYWGGSDPSLDRGTLNLHSSNDQPGRQNVLPEQAEDNFQPSNPSDQINPRACAPMNSTPCKSPSSMTNSVTNTQNCYAEQKSNNDTNSVKLSR